MDELQISGKRFISARRIARENGYTSDYIGQLIRGGKIVGQKVGRAWYVDAASFDRYLGSEATEVSVTPVDAIVLSLTPTMEPEVQKVPVETEAPLSVEEHVADKEEVATIVDEEKSTGESVTVMAADKAEDSQVAIQEEKAAEEVEEVPQRIPLRLHKHDVDVSQTPVGLRYYPDDVPVLPEIQRQINESRIVATKEEIYSALEKKISVPAHRTRKPMVAGSLIVAGLAVFIFSAVVSSAISLNLSIQEGNVAAVSYGLTW